MKCKHCGGTILDKSNFCEHCGKKVKFIVNSWLVGFIICISLCLILIVTLFLSKKTNTSLKKPIDDKDTQINHIEDSLMILHSQIHELDRNIMFLNAISKPSQIHVMTSFGTSEINFCNGIILDPGGTMDYPNNCDSYVVVAPNINSEFKIQIQGKYDIESCCDYLEFYDGTTINGTFLARYVGSGECNVTSFSGKLLIHFHSDASVVKSGYMLSITCVNNTKL